MIRVCYTVDSRYVGGAERYVELILGAIDRRRFEPALLVRDADGLREWAAAQASAGVEVRRVPMDLPFSPYHAPRMLATLAKLTPDIVHVNMPGPYDGQMGLLAPLARLAGARAVVTTEHLPMVERLWKRALVKRLSLPWVDRALTVSRANVAYLTRRQGMARDRVEVVYNGIDREFGRRLTRAPARRHFNIPDAAVAIAIVGAVSERKGVGPLLEALSGIRDSDADWRLLIAGDGPDRERFESKARTLHLDDRVRFLGSLAARDVELLLAGVDLVAVPSFVEGLPYVILEAMACSLPVVASDIYGIPEAAPHRDTALLVPPGDVASLRQALLALIVDPDRRRELGVRGRARFEEMFTLDRHIARIESIYQELLAGGR